MTVRDEMIVLAVRYDGNAESAAREGHEALAREYRGKAWGLRHAARMLEEATT